MFKEVGLFKKIFFQWMTSAPPYKAAGLNFCVTTVI